MEAPGALPYDLDPATCVGCGRWCWGMSHPNVIHLMYDPTHRPSTSLEYIPDFHEVSCSSTPRDGVTRDAATY